MADYVFGTAACGRAGQYIQNVIDNSPADADIIAVPLSVSGTAEQMETIATLAAALAAECDEQTDASWGRKTLTAANLTYAWDAANNRMEAHESDNLVWAAPATGFNTTGLLICYIPDNVPAVSPDTAVIPLVHLDMVVIANDQQVTFQWGADGFYNATRT